MISINYATVTNAKSVRYALQRKKIIQQNYGSYPIIKAKYIFNRINNSNLK